jgi:hypothetical protein
MSFRQRLGLAGCLFCLYLGLPHYVAPPLDGDTKWALVDAVLAFSFACSLVALIFPEKEKHR